MYTVYKCNMYIILRLKPVGRLSFFKVIMIISLKLQFHVIQAVSCLLGGGQHEREGH